MGEQKMIAEQTLDGATHEQSKPVKSDYVSFTDLPPTARMWRRTKSLTVRLQACAIFLSLVGLAFGLKSYFHIEHEFGHAASAPFMTDMYVQLGAAIVVNLLVAYIMYKICTHPIQELTTAMNDLTNNKLDVRVPYISRHNEIGSMARRVEVFKKSAIEKQEMEMRQADEERQAEKDKKRMMNELAEEFESSVGDVVKSLHETMSQFDAMSKTLSIVVEETNRKAEAASTATDNTSQNMQNVASATEQLNTSIEQVNDKTNLSTQTVQTAVEEATSANQRVEDLAGAMDEISGITTIIQNIAEQTNLLALNATIEAARAGEAGKGFAVVASEVKTLANETSSATEKISSKIAHLQSESKEVVEVIRKNADTIQSLEEITTAITEAIDHERAAIGEISRSVQETTRLTTDVSENIQGVSEATTQTESASKDVAKAVTYLKEQTTTLDESIASFLQQIRSA